MPVFNERATLRTAVDQVRAAEFPVERIEIILVDDGSTDGSTEIIDELAAEGAITAVRHDRNRGKGAAVRTALQQATGTYSAIMDADLEYNPGDIAGLLEPLLDGTAEAAVFGVRGFQAHSAHSFWYVIGNKGVAFCANLLFNSWISDIMTCHKVVRTDLFQSLDLREPGFAIEPEITVRLLQKGVRIYEVPAHYRARSRSEGKKLTAVDGFRVLRTLLRTRLGR